MSVKDSNGKADCIIEEAVKCTWPEGSIYLWLYLELDRHLAEDGIGEDLKIKFSRWILFQRHC